MKNLRLISLLVLATIVYVPVILAQDTLILEASTIEAFRARHIGPATMSGRISALDAVDSRPIELWVGSASGGLWKSNNGGVKFKPVFDKYTQSIGAIKIDYNRPDTVWVGTGEPWTRNSVSVGEGIYRTTDGGDSWKKMGLENTERIGRIQINPNKPDTVYVAALGHLWNPNKERGLFRTRDGGENWEKILYIDENTGCTDIAMAPGNPNVIYAAMWDFRRKAWTFRSGGPGSGLYRSTNGGDSWEKLESGLPPGELGRIAVSVSPMDNKLVYALIESEKSALYRSTNGGDNWEKVNKTIPVQERPFYFSNIIADPVDTNRVYKPSFHINVSNNKGENFRTTYVAGGSIHVDMHALWISSRNNNILYVGTDGGVYVSRDKGSTWTMLRNLPLSQFYHVAVDMEEPYNVYGGLQDNGSWYGPSKNTDGAIRNCNWTEAGFGDGFSMVPDPYDNNIVYWQYQGGEFFKFYKTSREIKYIKPFPATGKEKLRFNWDAPIFVSKKSKNIYVGSQYLHRSIDRGESWKTISPDLTTNDKAKQKQYETGGLTLDNSTAENHCTVVSIAESALDTDIIWAGTDDGNLQLSRDGGNNWTNTVSNIPGLPANTWCSGIYTSTFDKGTAFVTFDGHKTGDKTPYVYKTTDYGKSWKSLADKNIEGYCHKIIQDTERPSLLFLGTEFGLYVSFDEGLSWTRMKGNVPRVSVRDMVIHPRENDLVLGTHGRGIMIIDDIAPMRQISTELLDKDVAFLEMAPSFASQLTIGGSFGGDDEFRGQNPSDAAIISYYLKKRHIFGKMHLEIYDNEGNFLKKLPAGKRKGINRVEWPLMKKPPKVPSSPAMSNFAFLAPYYDPGEYTVKLIKGKESYEGKISIELNPKSPYPKEDRKIRIETINQGYKMLEDLAYIDARATSVMDQARKSAGSSGGSLKKGLLALADKLESYHKEMVETKMGGITGEEKIRSRIVTLFATTILYQGMPTKTQAEGLKLLETEVQEWDLKVNELLRSKLPSLNKKLEKKGLKQLEPLSLEEFKKNE